MSQSRAILHTLPMNAISDRHERAQELYSILVALWPDQGPLLRYANCFELLVAVVLSAQCTDEQVNKATPALFAAFPGPRELALAPLEQVEALVRTTGFYHHKAANIIAAAKLLVEEYEATVPDSIEELVRLPGVGRKTANLVVSACFGKPGIVVDTHVLRTARRLGIAPSDEANRSERMIAELLPEAQWTAFSFAINRLGKFFCKARKPLCADCPVRILCPSAYSFG
ncbi:MAG TPA: endonuclease III [Spirochaetaceae bacterium]|nr:endonuclease III [Spirochaetaceae bacterium]